MDGYGVPRAGRRWIPKSLVFSDHLGGPDDRADGSGGRRQPQRIRHHESHRWRDHQLQPELTTEPTAAEGGTTKVYSKPITFTATVSTSYDDPQLIAIQTRTGDGLLLPAVNAWDWEVKVDPSDPSVGLFPPKPCFPTESTIFPTETIRPTGTPGPDDNVVELLGQPARDARNRARRFSPLASNFRSYRKRHKQNRPVVSRAVRFWNDELVRMLEHAVVVGYERRNSEQVHRLKQLVGPPMTPSCCNSWSESAPIGWRYNSRCNNWTLSPKTHGCRAK